MTSGVKVPVLEIWGSVQYHFITITPRSTLTQRGNTCYDLIYGSNESVISIG